MSVKGTDLREDTRHRQGMDTSPSQKELTSSRELTADSEKTCIKELTDESEQGAEVGDAFFLISER